MNGTSNPKESPWTVTRNACKACAPLGAALAFSGLESGINLLHGSQGCSTYIRRYMISHFREPMDIASSNFTEESAVYGGKQNLETALSNIVAQYSPKIIGLTGTCLAETMGEDTAGFVRVWMEKNKVENDGLEIICASAPSYQGNHREGYQKAVYAIVYHFLHVDKDIRGMETKSNRKPVCVMPGMVSPADLRWIKNAMEGTGLDFILLPDYSRTLDGSPWIQYQLLPDGGTSLEDLYRLKDTDTVIELGAINLKGKTPGELLSHKTGAKLFSLPLPMGLSNTDTFFRALTEISGKFIPENFSQSRGRLIDSFVDANKVVFGKKTMLILEEDLAFGFYNLAKETGLEIHSILLSTCKKALPNFNDARIFFDSDFAKAEELASIDKPDLIISSSKGYKLSRKIGVPLIRAGFPVHDRYGGSRLLHLGYESAAYFFDQIVNAILEENQKSNPVGYTYY